MSDHERAALPPELVDHAVDRLLGAAPGDRDAVQRELLAAHPDHQAALRAMFAELGGTERLLEAAIQDASPELPQDLGGYRPVRHLGEGAFGVVHLCAQEHPVKRLVAVKVLRPGAGDLHTLRRFEAERQLLASLNHPAITQLFDAGHLPDGRPFFAMEYVDGLPITVHCERQRLTCAQRLQLFVEVCRGVAHAHARGVVHRDLKPGNVLVAEGVPAPQPKIIDFGIAKALDAAATPATNGPGATAPGRVLGTPGYMSPEQARGRAHEVDARSDVFALGVMLYEMLSGELPWSGEGSGGEEDPLLPSARITARSTRGKDPSSATPRRLAAQLRGDLDWITLKALARERERRYQSVGELIEDLERHRSGLPVLAGPPSASYRAAKFVRRHRTVLLAAGSALFVATLATLAASYLVRGSDTARIEAEDAAESNWQDATQAVEQLLARASDERMRRLPQSDAVRQALLRDALGFYERWLADRPSDHALLAARCRILVLLSRVHWQLGQLPAAQQLAEEARTHAAALHEADDGDLAVRVTLAGALRAQGAALASSGRTADALPLFTAAARHLEVGFRVAPAAHGLAWSSALREVAAAQQTLDRDEESLLAFRASLTVLETMLPSAAPASAVHNDIVVAAAGLAQQSLYVGRLDDAAALLGQAELRLPQVNFERPRSEAMVQNLLAELALRRRDANAAIPHVRAGIVAAEQWRRDEPQRLMPYELHYQGERRLGAVHEQLGEWSEADAAYRRAVAIAETMVESFREDPVRLAVLTGTLTDLAAVLWNRFRLVDLEQADPWARRALALSPGIDAAVDAHRRSATWHCAQIAARIADGRGEPSDALWEQVAVELAELQAKGAAPSRQRRSEAWAGLAMHRLARGRIADAELAAAAMRRVLADGEPVAKSFEFELELLAARFALARGEHAAAAAAAERLIECGGAWSGRWRAGETLYDAWRGAAVSPGDAHGDGCRDRALTVLREVLTLLAPEVEGTPDDPWVAVPFGFSATMVAEMEASRGDREAARRELARGLAVLRRVESASPRDYWDAARWRAASELELRLRGDGPPK